VSRRVRSLDETSSFCSSPRSSLSPGSVASRLTPTLMIFSSIRPCICLYCATLVWRLSACVAEVKEWMASRRPRLNASKIELIGALGAARGVKQCPAGPQLIGGAVVNPSATVRNLGVMMDSDTCPSRSMSTTSRPSATSTSGSCDLFAAH